MSEAMQFFAMAGFFGLFFWACAKWSKSQERCYELEQTIRNLEEAAAMRTESKGEKE